MAEVKFGTVAAFCGLGNPRAFWQTLEELEIDVAFRWAFGDHHHYKPAELERLAKQATECGAEALVTTEKDMMNFCDHAAAIVAPLQIAVVENRNRNRTGRGVSPAHLMRTAIFGGTFDPIHRAHLIVAREAADTFALDRVLFIPAANPPHKEAGASL